jgi:hypothetical protein
MAARPEVDPYAPPRAAGGTGAGGAGDEPISTALGIALGRVWRAGPLVVAERGAHLPGRCVRCNAPARTWLTMGIYWHSPWFYLLLVSIPVYLVVALLVRQRAEIAVPLCALHLRRRRRRILAAWAILLSSPVAWALAAQADDAAVLVAPVLLLLLAGITAIVFAYRVLAPKRISPERIWLKHASPAYLDSLPSGPSLL